MSQLFTDLSAEEQEVVAGGIDFSTNVTNLSFKDSGVGSSSTSGLTGTTTTSGGFDKKFFTSGNTLTGFNAPAIVFPAIPPVTFAP